jgi:16S rRNA (cytosine967-C5)-methyltransferase
MERAQRVAAKVVRRVLAGATLPAALAGAHEASAGERALVHELAYGTLRFLGQLRASVRYLADRPFADASVEALLWVALYQLIHTQAPPHVVVDCAVRATAGLNRTSAKGLVNAVLRNFLRRRKAVLAAVMAAPEARFSYPGWWIDRIRTEQPARCAEVLDVGNARPPLCLRVNIRRIAPETYVDVLAAADMAAERIGAAGVVLERPRPATELPGYANGWFSVQDAGAQLAAPLLGARDGMRVLDACAAPGGKTTHLAELANLDLTAVDIDAERLARMAENLDRLGLSARLIAGDAAEPGGWWNDDPFDCILADVPCTASGVVRRHPDIKWLRRESDLVGFVAQQSRLLDSSWTMLARGGRLLYSTCSIFRAENAAQIDAFLARHPDATRLPLPLSAALACADGQLLPAEGSAEHNHDGFFYALLQKS